MQGEDKVVERRTMVQVIQHLLKEHYLSDRR